MTNIKATPLRRVLSLALALTLCLSLLCLNAFAAKSDFFLADGNYYVNVDLWHGTSNTASMGDIAFENNPRALVTVQGGTITNVQVGTNPVDIDPYHSAIITFALADGTAVKVEETGSLTTKPAGKEYTYIKRVSFALPASAMPDIADAVTYVPVNFYVPDTPMDAAVGDTLSARLKFTWSTAEKTDATVLKVNDDTASSTVAVKLTDEATGVTVDTNSASLDIGATLTVDVQTKGEAYNAAAELVGETNGSMRLYTIRTDPATKGSVKLLFPCGADGLTIYGINADGTKRPIRGAVEDGYYAIRTTTLGSFAVIGEVPFTDMRAGAYYYNPAIWAYNHTPQVLKGATDTTFAPDSGCTRAQVVTFLWRAMNCPEPENTSCAFTDVDASRYYYKAVLWAAENGITTGKTATTFEPDAEVTRGEFVTFLWRALEKPASSGANPFTDLRDGAFYVNAVLWAAENNITTGKSATTFEPETVCTRGDVVTFLYRHFA